MKQRKLNIRALLLLFVFLLGTIGVNVSKVYCNRCQESYLHVMVIPADTPCSCTHGCACCMPSHELHEKACEAAQKQHTYYKVSGDWAVAHSEIQFCDIVQECDSQISFIGDITLVVKSFNLIRPYIDTSPPLELLCIFRC